MIKVLNNAIMVSLELAGRIINRMLASFENVSVVYTYPWKVLLLSSIY